MDLIQNLYETSTSPEHKLGELLVDQYGRKFRYAQAGAVALVTGHLLQEPAEDTNYRSMVVNAASAIGSFEISVTLGGTAVTANQFEYGDLVVESGTGIGQIFKILKHTVQTSTTGSVTFTVDRPVKVALVASDSQVSVRKSSYDGVIDWPTTPTGAPVGVAIVAIPIGEYGWIQSGGDATVLFDNTDNSAADAEGIVPSTTVAGSVKAALAADVADRHIGWSREEVSVDSTNGHVHLTID